MKFVRPKTTKPAPVIPLPESDDEIAKDVTFLIKSFLRHDCVVRLIESIRIYYPTVPILVVDDSAQEGEPPWCFDDVAPFVKTINLPFDSGLSAGRNAGVRSVETPYFLLLDDDFIFTEKTNVYALLNECRKGGFDILAGMVRDGNRLFDFYGNLSVQRRNGPSLVYRRVSTSGTSTRSCDIVVNFFIARTDAVRAYPWDDRLKVFEHYAFFYDCLKKIKVGFTPIVEVQHKRECSGEYASFRRRSEEFIAAFLRDRNLVSYTNWQGKHINVGELGIESSTPSRLSHLRTAVSTGMNHTTALENLVDVRDILSENGVRFWIADGTLLGAIRDGAFISHDTDTDVGVWQPTFTSAALASLEAAGFTISKVFGRWSDGFELALKRSGVKTDLFFYYASPDLHDGMYYHSAYANFTKTDSMKYDFIYHPFEIGEVEMYDESFPAPLDPASFLEQKYGSDWRTPKKVWSYYRDPINAVKMNVRVLKRHSEDDLAKLRRGLYDSR